MDGNCDALILVLFRILRRIEGRHVSLGLSWVLCEDVCGGVG